MVQIIKKCCFAFLVFLWTLEPFLGSDILDDYGIVGKEGWVWRSNFICVYNYGDKSIRIDLGPIHEQLAQVESASRARRVLIKSGEQITTNFISMGFTFIVEKGNGDICHQKPDLPLFPYSIDQKPIIFHSGQPFVQRKDQNFEFYPPDEHGPNEKLGDISKIVSDILEQQSEWRTDRLKEVFNCIKEEAQEGLTSPEQNSFMDSLRTFLRDRFKKDYTNPNIDLTYIKSLISQISSPDLEKSFKDSPKGKGAKRGKVAERFSNTYLHSEQAMLMHLHDLEGKGTLSELLSSYLSNLRDEGDKAIGVILHIHSTRDICKRCALSLSDELVNGDLFIKTMKKIILDYMKAPQEDDEDDEDDEYDEQAFSTGLTFNIVYSSGQSLCNEKGGSRKLRRYVHGNDDHINDSIDFVQLSKKGIFVCVPLPFTSPDWILSYDDTPNSTQASSSSSGSAPSSSSSNTADD